MIRKDDEKDSEKICGECSGKEKDIYRKHNVRKCCCSCVTEKHDYIEDIVCHQKDINENEMKVVALGDENKKVLLIKQKDEIHAIGTKCTHYGALLHTGALGDGRIRCPWHGACFNIKTGDIEDYPGLDSLPCYKVTVDDTGFIRVRAKRKDLEMNRRTKEMCKFDPNFKQTVIIVGGGPAGATCAETLRQEGFIGKIIMVAKEKMLPYDRVKVSKVMDFDVKKALLRPASFYEDHSIEIKLGIEATDLDTSQNAITLNTNEKLHYNHLFICTGSKPRMLNVSGANLTNIFVMRNYTDASAVHSQLSPEKYVVVLGLSFIGMEAAAYCIDKCASVTVIGRDTVPLKATFGAEIGDRVRKEYESKGVKFVFQSNITQLIPKDDNENEVGTVELSDGSILQADIVIIGIGSTFYTDWIKDPSIKTLDNGSIVTNQFLRTSVSNVYAGGDIAYAPLYKSEISAAIGHYPLAHYHGKIAALNICGKETALNAVPFFWTTLFGKSYRYAGYGKASSIKIHGSLDNFEFFAYYFKDGKVIAMSSVGADPVVADFANLLYEGKSLTEGEVEKDPLGWIRNKPKDAEKRFKFPVQ